MASWRSWLEPRHLGLGLGDLRLGLGQLLVELLDVDLVLVVLLGQHRQLRALRLDLRRDLGRLGLGALAVGRRWRGAPTSAPVPR